MANVLSEENRAMILRTLSEGNSIPATARMTDTSKNTVSSRTMSLSGARLVLTFTTSPEGPCLT